MHMVFGDPAPSEIIKWVMAEKFGWSLEYIDGLPVPVLFEFLQIEEGKSKAHKQLSSGSKRGKRW